MAKRNEIYIYILPLVIFVGMGFQKLILSLRQKRVLLVILPEVTKSDRRHL